MNKEEPTVWANTVSHVYVQIFYVEHLAKASRRRRLRLVRTIPGHLINENKSKMQHESGNQKIRSKGNYSEPHS